MSKELTHVMVDIETVGRPPDGGIIAVGAVAFNPALDPANQKWDRTFEVIFDLNDVDRRGGKFEASTIKWWMNQDATVRTKMFNGTVGVVRGFRDFLQWYRYLGPTAVWANGTTFDIVMLEHSMKRAGVATPWHFRDVRDMRMLRDLETPAYALAVNTLYQLCQDTQHDALQDAVVQAKSVCVANTFLKVYRP